MGPITAPSPIPATSFTPLWPLMDFLNAASSAFASGTDGWENAVMLAAVPTLMMNPPLEPFQAHCPAIQPLIGIFVPTRRLGPTIVVRSVLEVSAQASTLPAELGAGVAPEVGVLLATAPDGATLAVAVEMAPDGATVGVAVEMARDGATLAVAVEMAPDGATLAVAVEMAPDGATLAVAV